MEFYKRGHILPPALLNFAALLGWRPPTTAKQSDVMSPRKMIENVRGPPHTTIFPAFAPLTLPRIR